MPALTVDIIAMEFPCPSETFAGNDVRSLVRQGVQVKVQNLRPEIQDSSKYLSDWGLQDLPISHLSQRTFANFFLNVFTKIHWYLYLIYWLITNKTTKTNQFLKSLILLPRVVEIAIDIRSRKPNIVHIFWGHYPCMVAALVQRFITDVQVSIFLGSYDLVMRYPGSVDVANRASSVWTHAKANIADIRAMGVNNENVSIVYRGIDFKERAPSTNKRAEIKGHRIVSVGRLIESKGFDESLEILAILLKNWPETTLTIIGEGTELENLRRKATTLGVSEAVTFCGHLPHDQVFETVRNSDIFLLMSWLDGERLPNVVKEAMLCRTLCVSTNTVGMDELIEDGKHGFIVNMHDVVSASENIHQIFSENIDYQEVSDNAFNHLVSNFDLDKNIHQYIEQWQSVIRNA